MMLNFPQTHPFIVEWSDGQNTYATGVCYASEFIAQRDMELYAIHYPQYAWTVRRLKGHDSYVQHVPDEMNADIKRQVEEFRAWRNS